MPNGFAIPVGGELVFCAAIGGPSQSQAGSYFGHYNSNFDSMMIESSSVSFENKTTMAEAVLDIKPGKYKIGLFGITTDSRYLANARLVDSSGDIILQTNLNLNSMMALPFTEIYLSGKYKPQVYRQISGYSSAILVIIYKD